MCHSVDTGGRCKALRRVHHHVGVDNRHVRHQLIVRERIFDPADLVGDDGERRDLRAGARRGRNGDKIRLLAHLRERIDALSDIDKTHGHVLEIRFGMFVEHPHDLTGVHCGAAADGDDAIRFKGAHLRGAFAGAGKRRIRRHVVEGRVRNPHLVELIGNRLGIAVFIQERVGDDERFLGVAHGSQLI